MRTLVLLALLGACSEPPGDPYPVNPGGSNPSGGTTPADAPSAGSDGGELAGRVCLLADLRAHATCASSGAEGVTVELGSGQAVTAADGRFSIATQTASNLVWRISGPDLVTSIMPFTPNFVLPAISIERYQQFTLENGVTFTEGEGHVFARLVANGSPLPAATVAMDPPTASVTFYDGNSVDQWDQDATGEYGIAWLPDATPGVANVIVQPTLADPVLTPILVVDSAITFVTIDASPQ